MGRRDAPNRWVVDERDREEMADLLNAEDFVTASQWFTGRVSNESPERNFLRVVLATGLHELKHFPPGHAAHEAAKAWLLEDHDNGNLCSFLQLCAILDFDSSAVRRGVLARLEAGTFSITREARVPDARPKTLHAKKAA